MGAVLPHITDELRSFIEAQPVYFVATAPLAREGHVNLSPKGLDTFRVLSPSRVAYLDLTGSGNETAAHLQENGRITLILWLRGPSHGIEGRSRSTHPLGGAKGTRRSRGLSGREERGEHRRPSRGRGRLERALTLLRIAAVVYLCYLGLLFIVQRRALFPGESRVPPRASSDALPGGAAQLWLNTPTGRVEAWLLEGDTPGPGPALLFAHGNGELIDDWREPMEALREAGFHVLLVEFPGYGFSEGRPTRSSIRSTLESAFDRLATHARVDPSRIVAMGRSLGGAAVAELSLERELRALILLSTFTSAGDMAWQGFRAPPFLLRDRFDTRPAMRDFEGPVLLMHGRDDDLIPFRHAERLAALRNESGAATGDPLAVIPLDCAHNDCLAVWPTVVSELLEFLRAEGVR